MSSLYGAARYQGANSRATNQHISYGKDPLTFVDNEDFMSTEGQGKKKRKRGSRGRFAEASAHS